MDAIIQRASGVHGNVTVPPDKAICHRVVLLAAVADGETELGPWPDAEDCQRTAALIEGLGVPIRRLPSALRIVGQGRDGLVARDRTLFCGDSGTTLRLASGVLAGQPCLTTLTAGPSLSRRPMRRIAEPLSRMGATLEGTRAAGDSEELFPPLTIHGRRPLRPIQYEMELASAQVKSAILFAGLFAQGRTMVVEQIPTRDHTERALQHFGIRIVREGLAVSLEPGRLSAPGSVVLPGDVSSAAFFIVAAACVPGSRLELHGVGLNPTRTGFLTVLERMGAQIRHSVSNDEWEPRGRIAVEARPLRGTTVEPQEVPALIDELPILMVAAACAQGTSCFRGIGELRVKETDRLHSMITGLERLGVRVHRRASETLEIEGGRLRGAVVESAQDHRTAMSLAVAGLVAEGRPTTVRGADCVAKSFPDFFDHLRQVSGSSTVKTVDKG